MSSSRLHAAFAAKPAFVAFLTAGYPSLASTVPALVAMQAAGVDVIEVGVPFSDPLADGGTIAKANHAALANGVTLAWVLGAVRDARAAGVTAPIVLMGYINPILSYGEERLAVDASAAGVDGFIVVDLLPEDSGSFTRACGAHGMHFVPLIAPTTTDARLALIAAPSKSPALAPGFVYCVSVTGVTGARSELPTDLAAFVARVRAAFAPTTPLAVGFGISTRSHVDTVSALPGVDGVVVGSAIVKALEEGGVEGLAVLLKGLIPAKRS